MTKLVIKIIHALYPGIHDSSDRDLWKVHSSKESMVNTLLDLQDEELIKLYDTIVHNLNKEKI